MESGYNHVLLNASPKTGRWHQTRSMWQMCSLSSKKARRVDFSPHARTKILQKRHIPNANIRRRASTSVMLARKTAVAKLYEKIAKATLQEEQLPIEVLCGRRVRNKNKATPLSFDIIQPFEFVVLES